MLQRCCGGGAGGKGRSDQERGRELDQEERDGRVAPRVVELVEQALSQGRRDNSERHVTDELEYAAMHLHLIDELEEARQTYALSEDKWQSRQLEYEHA